MTAIQIHEGQHAVIIETRGHYAAASIQTAVPSMIPGETRLIELAHVEAPTVSEVLAKVDRALREEGS